MTNMLPLILTFVTGLFILVGTLIVFLIKNNERFIHFSISMAFGVIVSLIVLELIPEAIEHINVSTKLINYLIVFVFIVIGFLVLKLLDLLIPHHHNHEHPDKDGKNNLYHIGIVSSIALILHNIIEGMAIYSTSVISISLGVLISLGVGLHNIPIGMVITSTIYKATNNMKKTLMISIILSLSTFLGGFIMSFIKLNELINGIMFSLIIGMTSYIAVFELFPPIYHNKKRSIGGIAFGILVFLISLLFHSH